MLSAADTTGTAQPSVTAGVLDLLEVRTLFESGKGAGKLDAEEIALALDELELEPAQLDEFYTALEEAQVDVVGNEADRGGRREASGPPRPRSPRTPCSSSSRTSARCRS